MIAWYPKCSKRNCFLSAGLSLRLQVTGYMKFIGWDWTPRNFFWFYFLLVSYESSRWSSLTLYWAQYPNTNSSDWSTYISLKNWSREVVCISKLFLSGDYFINSHIIFPWLCIDFVWRKLTLVTLGTERVKVAGGSPDLQPLIDSSESAQHKLQRKCYQNTSFHQGDQAIKPKQK